MPTPAPKAISALAAANTLLGGVLPLDAGGVTQQIPLDVNFSTFIGGARIDGTPTDVTNIMIGGMDCDYTGYLPPSTQGASGFAIGIGSYAYGGGYGGCIASGYQAAATGLGVSIGAGARGPGGCCRLGDQADGTSIAIGYQAGNDGSYSGIAIGHNAYATAQQMCIGNDATTGQITTYCFGPLSGGPTLANAPDITVLRSAPQVGSGSNGGDLTLRGGLPTGTGALGGLAFGSGLGLVSLADSAAPNDSIYYSTTASKPAYKDAGGTVHALY